jgi:hypothetical protein
LHLFGELRRLSRGDHPAYDVAAENIEQDVKMEARPSSQDDGRFHAAASSCVRTLHKPGQVIHLITPLHPNPRLKLDLSPCQRPRLVSSLLQLPNAVTSRSDQAWIWRDEALASRLNGVAESDSLGGNTEDKGRSRL